MYSLANNIKNNTKYHLNVTWEHQQFRDRSGDTVDIYNIEVLHNTFSEEYLRTFCITFLHPCKTKPNHMFDKTFIFTKLNGNYYNYTVVTPLTA